MTAVTVNYMSLVFPLLFFKLPAKENKNKLFMNTCKYKIYKCLLSFVLPYIIMTSKKSYSAIYWSSHADYRIYNINHCAAARVRITLPIWKILPLCWMDIYPSTVSINYICLNSIRHYILWTTEFKYCQWHIRKSSGHSFKKNLFEYKTRQAFNIRISKISN